MMNLTDNQREITGRDSSGRFAVGNPGRPVGAKGKASREVLERIKLMGPAALQKLWEAVNLRERWAIELVLEKILPATRSVEFEGLEPEDIKAALQAGDITPSEAKDVSDVMKNANQMEAWRKYTQR